MSTHRALMLAAVFLACLPGPVNADAAPRIEVQALMSDRAMLEINGKTLVLRVGQRSAEGVLLRKVDVRGADLEVNGVSMRMGLGTRAGGAFSAPGVTQVWITRAANGMYEAPGSINGRAVVFTVDTGATTVAMNSTQADALGIRYRNEAQAGRVQTAAGITKGYAVRLREVRVGTVRLTEVDGVVLDGPQPPQVLLGMSFLSRTRMRNEAGALVLESASGF